jgi:hypothetical protein
MNDATRSAALRILIATVATYGYCSIDSLPNAVAEEIVEEGLVAPMAHPSNPEATVWTVTVQGEALAGASLTVAARPFRSALAAKQAFARAVKAWEAKRSEGLTARDTYQQILREHNSIDGEQYADLRATEMRCEREAVELFEGMRSVYDMADSQGWTLYSHDARWHFGQHTTRDLIHANMD